MRSLILGLLALLFLPSAEGQAVERKHLIIVFGAGAGVLQFNSNEPDLETDAMKCGAVRLNFGYAISDRWSLGIHYDRLGTSEHRNLDRSHVTTYMLETSYRPWTGEHAALEIHAGLGAMAAALYPIDARLPFVAGGSAVALGVRYLHLITPTIGAFTAFDHTATSSNELTLEGGSVDPSGTPVKLQWNAQRISAGLFVRF